jgi:hypothetical protein
VAHLLRGAGCDADISVVELSGLPFDVEARAGSVDLVRRRPVAAAVHPQQRSSVVERLATYLPDMSGAPTLLDSSFADGSALVELPTLLLGGPAARDIPTDIPVGAHPVASMAFRSLIGPRHGAMIADLADERRRVAAAFGVRDLPSDEGWVDHVAGGTEPGTIRTIPDEPGADALVRNGVLGSLVPLVSAGDIAGVPVPVTRALIVVAESILDTDLSSLGRSLPAAGFADQDAGVIRSRIAAGGRL